MVSLQIKNHFFCLFFWALSLSKRYLLKFGVSIGHEINIESYNSNIFFRCNFKRKRLLNLIGTYGKSIQVDIYVE